MSRGAYREIVRSLIRDDAGAISDDDCLDALGHAVSRYSRFRPRRLIADLATPRVGIASRDVASDLASWDETSGVVSVERPVGEIPPQFTDFDLYLAPNDAVYLYVPVVQSGETVRVTYTVPHVVDADSCTVPDADSEAVASWAAARLLEELAARGAATTDSTIRADAVDHESQANDYRMLAKGYRDRFYELLGIDRKDEMRTPGASGVAELEPRRLAVGWHRLTHRSRSSYLETN